MDLSRTTSWGSFLWRLPIFVTVWVLVMAVKAAVALLGLVMVAFLYRYRKDPFDSVPAIFTPWKNPEDWNDKPKGNEDSLPTWWVKRRGSSTFWDWYKYHAIRNPANGLRNYSLFVISFDKSPEFEYICDEYRKDWGVWTAVHRDPERKTWWYVCWFKFQLGMAYYHRWNDDKHIEIKLGWRINPTDKVDGQASTSVRKQVGSGFASKFLPWRDSK